MRPATNNRGTARDVVELIGPAGAGKSTLLQAMRDRDHGIRGGLALWGLPRSTLLLGALRVIPTALGALVEGRPLRSAELGQMVRMEALRLQVKRTLRAGRGLVVLDEGPIFGFAWLRVFHRVARSKARQQWWRRALRAWADTLGAVVQLDAPDAELARRIRSRRKPHLFKHATDPEIRQFSATFRSEFRAVLDEIEATHALKVVAIGRETLAADHQAEALLHRLTEAADGQ